MSDLALRVHNLVDIAHAELAETSHAADIHNISDRLTSPLRVAVAGKVKAGKSTLVNALVGESLAPTDFSECTTIVTWYRDGTTYRVTAHPNEGPSSPVPFSRDDGELKIELGNFHATDIARLEVEWPSAALSSMTLIDTPGIDSINADLSARTHDFLTSEETAAPTDAVLYLMRHLHESDVRFLEAFHDQVAAQPTPINSVGILSRSDEVGVARLDAMQSAKRIADRYSRDVKVRRLCQTVLPVAGLLASTATTLREDEYRDLGLLAVAGATERDDMLLSADRFISSVHSDVIDASDRQALLERFGLFGVRLACQLIRDGRAPTSQGLADELKERSGLNELTTTIHTHFGARSDVLRARSALLALNDVLTQVDTPIARRLLVELERIASNVHEFAEIQLLNAIRAGVVALPTGDVERAEILLGAKGTLAHQRLGAMPDTSGDTLTSLAHEMHRYWQQLTENPLMTRSATDASRTLVRTCEGLVAGLGQRR